MAEAARELLQPMTVAAFLAWDDDSDTRYELVGGQPVAMAPPANAHALIVVNVGGEIRNRRPPGCRVFADAGIRVPQRDDAYYQPDIVVSCAVERGGGHGVVEPILIIEVLSPSTAAHDRGTKVPDYRMIPSLQEIVLLFSSAPRAEIWRRSGVQWVVSDLIGLESSLSLASVGIEVPLAAIFDGVSFEAESPEAPADEA
ncbi:MAG: Uma2 family endonuclease [Alphaproteobacteria bacterium]|nr:Uma2 family endonuclease [Alphaproteobacteria bacterium]